MLEELMEVHDNLEEVGDVEIVEEHVVDDEQEIVVVDDKVVVALQGKINCSSFNLAANFH